VAAGARVYTGTRAVSIEHDGSRARAVQCDRDGTPVRITAGRVVVSAGPVHSSLLLRRSGITRNVGTRVGFNVVTWVHAEFREPMDAESQRSAFHLDSRFSIRTVRLAPETFAASMPAWYDDHFDNMLRYRYFATAAVTVRTLATGSVRPESDGPGRIDFALPISDLRKMRTGIREACRIWLAAGAARVLPPTTEAVAFTHPDQLERLDELIVEAEDLVLTSTAPQGGNPMSDDAEVGAVDTRFRVFGFDNLHVTDGSIVPSPVADGPQLTIMALAHIAAQRMPQ
jgi:choline dehydrogenase-like flavoprotein